MQRKSEGLLSILHMDFIVEATFPASFRTHWPRTGASVQRCHVLSSPHSLNNIDFASVSDTRLLFKEFQGEKDRDLTQSYDKIPYTQSQSKIHKATWQHKHATKTLITQRLRTDLGRSVALTTVTPLMLLNRFTSAQHSHLPQKSCNQKDSHLKNCKQSSL